MLQRSPSPVCRLLPWIVPLAACGVEPGDPVLAYRQADYPAARKGFEARATSGDREAKNVLGVMFQLGLAVEADAEHAAALFREAALAGSIDAQNNLGMLYQRGHGVPQDLMLAYGWFNLASRGGHVVAKAHAEALGSQLSANMAKLGREAVERLFRGAGGGPGQAGGVHAVVREGDHPTTTTP